MDTGLLYACKGEMLSRIEVYKDHIDCKVNPEKFPIEVRKRRVKGMFLSLCPTLGIRCTGETKEEAKLKIKSIIRERIGEEKITLHPNDIGCLKYFNNQLCDDVKCRHYIENPEIDNCTLCVFHDYTQSEISRFMGVSREMTSWDVETALRKAEKGLRKLRKIKPLEKMELVDFLPDPPYNRENHKRSHK